MIEERLLQIFWSPRLALVTRREARQNHITVLPPDDRGPDGDLRDTIIYPTGVELWECFEDITCRFLSLLDLLFL